MQPSTTYSFFLLITLHFFLLIKNCSAGKHFSSCDFESIFQFGDSLQDTGNLIRIDPNAPASHLPYGQTYFHKPTGRFSNGLLIIDFITMAFHLPLLNPYLDRTAKFDHGVNFAVAGSTALDSSFFRARNVPLRSTNVPLNAQLHWFKGHLNNSLQPWRVRDEVYLRKALVFVGEIGGNDYNHAILRGNKSIEEVKTYTNHVVNLIINATREIIRLGATTIVVPGNFPIGCLPSYLTSFPSNDPKAYDEKGCLKSFNELALRHNDHLRRALALLSHEMSDTSISILYGDYYNAFQRILRRATDLGFDSGSSLKACCGIGGRYDYNATSVCGSPGVPVCSDPERYIHWDGVHLTQEAYRHIADFLIADILRKSKAVNQ